MNSIPQKSNSITIDTGEVKLLINDDPDRVISFNPDNLTFVSALYETIQQFSILEADINKKLDELGENNDVDKFGIPVNTKEVLKINKELCEEMRIEIDKVFGEGASQTAFGSFNSPDMFAQFFDGITPFVKAKRDAQMNKHRVNELEAGMMG